MTRTDTLPIEAYAALVADRPTQALPNRPVTNITREAKRYLVDLMAGVAPSIRPELIELRWLGLVDRQGQPTDLARAQPWA